MDVMTDVKLNSVDEDKKITCVEDERDDKPKSHDSLTKDLNSSTTPESSTAAPTQSLTEVTTLSEQIPNEDSELSFTDLSVNGTPCHNTFPDISLAALVDSDLHNKPRAGESRALPICGPWSVEKDQPQPLCALLPSSTGHCSAHETSQSCTSISRSQQSLKTTTVQTEPSYGDDPCASILLACLFCRPLDCVLATMSGCSACVSSLCASLCGCEPGTLQPLLDIPRHCDRCGCLGVRCCLCDCPVCDICLQATECLDLAMEISQMLYH